MTRTMEPSNVLAMQREAIERAIKLLQSELAKASEQSSDWATVCQLSKAADVAGTVNESFKFDRKEQ